MKRPVIRRKVSEIDSFAVYPIIPEGGGNVINDFFIALYNDANELVSLKLTDGFTQFRFLKELLIPLPGSGISFKDGKINLGSRDQYGGMGEGTFDELYLVSSGRVKSGSPQKFTTVHLNDNTISLLKQIEIGQYQEISFNESSKLIRIDDRIAQRGLGDADDYSANKQEFDYATKKMVDLKADLVNGKIPASQLPATQVPVMKTFTTSGVSGTSEFTFAHELSYIPTTIVAVGTSLDTIYNNGVMQTSAVISGSKITITCKRYNGIPPNNVPIVGTNNLTWTVIIQ